MFCKLDAQQCIIRGEYSIRGMMLKGHTFIEEKTGIWLNCLDKCEDDVRCQSFNYVISQGICELNNRTKEARPEDFVPDSDRFYMKRLDGRGIVRLWMFIYIVFLRIVFIFYTNVPGTSLHRSRKLRTKPGVQFLVKRAKQWCFVMTEIRYQQCYLPFLFLIPLGSISELQLTRLPRSERVKEKEQLVVMTGSFQLNLPR